MKILLINNFHYNRGGDCTYFFSLKKLLEKKGHKVVCFSMHHPQNYHSAYSKYFVSYINYADENKKKTILNGFKVLCRATYSKEASINLEKLIKNEKPNIAHLNNIHHHITPSILATLKKYNIPIIWTLHDYSIICPNSSFLNHGKVCERCKKTKYYWPFLVKCKKGSFAASLVAAIESSVHRLMKIYDLVDYFIAPSNFLMNKFIEFGFNQNKVTTLPYFINNVYTDEKFECDKYYLYVGRISEEKGLKTLIDAACKVKKYNLKIIGNGPVKEAMVRYAKSRDKNRVIEFLGYKNHNELMRFIRKSLFVVVPSEWYENYPFSILESFSCGKTVIGSRIGGIPELVRDHETGLTFETSNSEDLIAKIEYFINNPKNVNEMGNTARKFVAQEINAEKHYTRLKEIYDLAISHHS